MESAMTTWIIPVYNCQKYLKEAMLSILKQPCKALKLIVVDDGSTDNSLEIAKSVFDDRVTVVHKENGGVSSACNLGISMVDTPYVAFLDADDVLCKDVYNEEIYKVLCTNKYDILDFGYYEANQNITKGNLFKVQDGDYYCEALKENPWKSHSSAIYSKSIFDGEVKAFFPEGIVDNEDIVFRFLAYINCVKKINFCKPFFIYRNNLTSERHYNSYYKRLRNILASWYWCKNYCIKQEHKDRCDRNIVSACCAIIREGCAKRIKIDEVMDIIKSEIVQTSLKSRGGREWSKNAKFIEEFLKNPKSVSKKIRFKSIPMRVAEKIAYIPLFRKTLFVFRYRENLKDYKYDN